MARRELALLQVLLRRPEPRFGLVVGFAVAVVLHLLVVPGAGLIPGSARTVASSTAPWRGVSAATRTQRVELAIREEPAKVIPPPPAPEPEPLPKGQIVNLPTRTEARPDAADYLAEQDQRTERETRARITGFTENATRKPSTADVVTDAPDDDGANGDALPEKTQPEAEKGGPVGDGNASDGDALAWSSRTPGGGEQTLALDRPRRDPLEGLRRMFDGEVKVQRQRDGIDGNALALRLAMGRIAPLQAPLGDGALGSGFSRRGGTGDDGAFGQRSTLPGDGASRRTSGLPRNDALLVEQDAETNLNTLRFRHATYFNRIADAIRRTWVGGEVMGQVDPTGRAYGREDRQTMVQITIDLDGNVVDLALMQPSGAEPLDDEALRAIRAAGPFPNPPRILFEGSDRFSFAFGFTVNFNRASLDLNWAPY